MCRFDSYLHSMSNRCIYWQSHLYQTPIVFICTRVWLHKISNCTQWVLLIHFLFCWYNFASIKINDQKIHSIKNHLKGLFITASIQFTFVVHDRFKISHGSKGQWGERNFSQSHCKIIIFCTIIIQAKAGRNWNWGALGENCWQMVWTWRYPANTAATWLARQRRLFRHIDPIVTTTVFVYGYRPSGPRSIFTSSTGNVLLNDDLHSRLELHPTSLQMG